MDNRGRNENGIYPIEQFHYDAEKDQFICPQVRGFGTGEFTNTVGSMSIGQVLRTVGSVL